MDVTMKSARLLGLFLSCCGCGHEPASLLVGGVDGAAVEHACDESSGWTGDAFADCVEDFLPADDASFGHDQIPEIVLGPPNGAAGGGIDVASLGCGGRITLYFDGPGIVDGPGPDFIVFENPFALADATFSEPARVLVSDDGARWGLFACIVDGTATWPPEGCAGVTPVASGAGDDFSTDPDRAGGDAFDLAEVGLDRARWVRIVDMTEDYYGDRMWCTGPSGGFDLDAVAAVHSGS